MKKISDSCESHFILLFIVDKRLDIRPRNAAGVTFVGMVFVCSSTLNHSFMRTVLLRLHMHLWFGGARNLSGMHNQN